jgi:hypothetical protein
LSEGSGAPSFSREVDPHERAAVGMLYKQSWTAKTWVIPDTG